MNEERLIDALSELDDELINAHLEEKAALEGLAARRKRVAKRRNKAMLASLGAAVLLLLLLLPAALGKKDTPVLPGASTDDPTASAPASPLPSPSLPDVSPSLKPPLSATDESFYIEPPTSESKNDDPPLEPEKFTTSWLEWLVTDYGDTYPMVWEGGLYGGIKYTEDMEPSAFEIRPYTDKIPNEFSHFHLCMYMSSAEFDGYSSLGKEDYSYTWKVFYRPDGSDEDYESVEMVPWSAITFGDNYFYRLNLHDYGAKLSLKEDGSTQTYHFIFIILDQEGEIVTWRDELVDWTDSSQAYYEDALAAGAIKELS